MKHYLLLRDNRQSGPFSLGELTSSPLYADDLIWVEGISTSWQSATAFEVLQPLIQAKPVKTIVTKARSLSPTIHSLPSAAPVTQQAPLRERLRQWEPRGPVFRKKLFKIGDGGRFMAVLAGLFLTAAVMKKMADAYAVAPELTFNNSSASAAVATRAPVPGAKDKKTVRIAHASEKATLQKKEDGVHGAGSRRLISYQPTLIKLK